MFSKNLVLAVGQFVSLISPGGELLATMRVYGQKEMQAVLLMGCCLSQSN